MHDPTDPVFDIVPKGGGIILFDGVCVLCSASFRFVAARDPLARFRFVAVQTPCGRRVAARLGIDPDAPQTVALLIDGQAYVRSDAALQVLRRLPAGHGSGCWQPSLARCATGCTTASRATAIACLAAPLRAWFPRRSWRGTSWRTRVAEARVLVVGAAGVFGSRLVAGLLETTSFQVIAAGRDPKRLAALAARHPDPRLSTRRLDALTVSAAELRQTGAFCVVDAAGPFQQGDTRLARAAIEAGIHFIDLADARDFVAGFGVLDASARDAGVAALTGCSSTPALSNAALDAITAGWRQVGRGGDRDLTGQPGPARALRDAGDPGIRRATGAGVRWRRVAHLGRMGDDGPPFHARPGSPLALAQRDA